MERKNPATKKRMRAPGKEKRHPQHASFVEGRMWVFSPKTPRITAIEGEDMKEAHRDDRLRYKAGR